MTEVSIGTAHGAKPILRYGPHEASAADARRRITAFFSEHL
ncbi:hypothetical protein [Dactylosporangium sp. CA-139066]